MKMVKLVKSQDAYLTTYIFGSYRYGLVHITRTGSVLATLCVTIERFFAIVYPLKMIKKTRFLIIISLFASVSYNIPRFFEFETKYDDDYAEGNDYSKYPSNHSKVKI